MEGGQKRGKKKRDSMSAKQCVLPEEELFNAKGETTAPVGSCSESTSGIAYVKEGNSLLVEKEE